MPDTVYYARSKMTFFLRFKRKMLHLLGIRC